MRVAVTGAFGFSGRYIAQRLLALRHEVITLTNSPDRSNPFVGSIKAFRYNFSKPRELEKSLSGIDVLMNTYWVRFDNPPHFTFAQAIANSSALLNAAKRAGVGRIVHISITNPDPNSPLPYFRGKAKIEDYLKQIGISYAILRPAVLFGKEDILINNIAWALRRLPVFGIYGAGRYRLQPIYVDDLAMAAVDQIRGATNETIDAIGPETYSYRGMVEVIAREIGSRALIMSMPPMLAYQAVRVLGWTVGDVINTRDEVRGLMQEKLYVQSPPLGTTKLSGWVRESCQHLGRRYASELQRRLDCNSYPFLCTRICALLAAIICAERCRREASASIVSSEIKTHARDAQTPDAHVRPSQGRPGTAGRGHHGAREQGCRSASHRGARRSPG